MANMVAKLAHYGRPFESFLGDLFLNVNTRGPIHFAEERGINRDAFNFETIAHTTIMKTIRLVRPKSDDVVFVLGSGKGRAVCHFARQPVRKVVGIELSRELCEIARVNAAKLRSPRAPIEIRHGDAAVADLSEGTIFFMFNPFGENTLRQVLGNIQNSNSYFDCEVRVIYMNARYSYTFEEFPWLEIAFEYVRARGQRVIIYRSCPTRANQNISGG